MGANKNKNSNHEEDELKENKLKTAGEIKKLRTFLFLMNESFSEDFFRVHSVVRVEARRGCEIEVVCTHASLSHSLALVRLILFISCFVVLLFYTFFPSSI